MIRRLPQLALLTVCLSAALPCAAVLIVNGDFESSTASGSVPDGWVASGGNPSNPAAYTGDSVVPPASGDWALDLGPAGDDALNGGSISQTFFVSTPGSYLFSFAYTNELNDPENLADFSWNLSGIVSDSETLFDIGGGYETFSRVYVVESPGNITVTFNDITGLGKLYDAVLDDVAFTVVPEPLSATILGLGFILLMILRRRR